MKRYISDLHFFHEALNDRMDCRGFENASVMNEYIIKQWNKKVNRKDEVFILGDLSFGKAEETMELIKRLNGRLHLVQGNHDRYLSDKKFDQSLFVWVKQYAEVNDSKRRVVMCHYPVMCYHGQYRLDKNGNPKTYMLYGHVHNTHDQRLMERFIDITRNSKAVLKDMEEETAIPCQMINCFCMKSNYQPLTLDEWIELG